nr:unnamed protein product [Digitaria exilis]
MGASGRDEANNHGSKTREGRVVAATVRGPVQRLELDQGPRPAGTAQNMEQLATNAAASSNAFDGDGATYGVAIERDGGSDT